MNLHQNLIETKATLYYAHAGAGTAFAQQLWQTPGCSEYFAGATLLQARNEFDRFIGFPLDIGYCCKEAAIDLATAAYLRAAQAKETPPHEGENIIGLATTASVATTRIPRGDQRAHIAIVTQKGVFHQQLELAKATGFYARMEHDKLIAETTVAFLREALDKHAQANANQDAIIRLKLRPLFDTQGQRAAEENNASLFFPANFNPIHCGHHHAYLQAEEETGLQTTFMLEAQPPHKEEIPIAELLRRIANLHRLDTKDARPVLLTFGQGTYLAKAKTRLDAHFIAGADAIIRILEPYWGYDVGEMLAEFENLKTVFHVLGRHNGVQLVTVDQIEIPAKHRHRFRHLEGQHDVSSTELRQQKKL